MKKLLIFLFAFLSIIHFAKASTGDTTWVQAQNNWIDNYGNYDTTFQFPSGNTGYRKIYMIFTLGKHQCPGNPQYCGDWDYTIQNFLMTPAGDTIELGRLISPYANVSYFPFSWQKPYVFDVTDYYPLLKNTATMRLFYSGYSGGFTANVRFAFVEGTPARTVLGIQSLWNGSFPYGDANNPIENHLPELTETAPANTQTAEMKFIVTGHGSDAIYCSEFCKKYYQVYVNNNMLEQTDIWRDNCGYNNLYPQSGTWLLQRANWCPGDLVQTNVHKLTGVTGGNYSVNVDMQPYTTANPAASYTISGAVVYYGAFNHTLDASLDEIVAPTNAQNEFRANPICGSPTVHVTNSGSTTISAISFSYGVNDSVQSQYTWQGTLASLSSTDISLPELWQLHAVAGTTATNLFKAKITQVNGQADEDASNDTLSSSFIAAPLWPTKFAVNLTTNNAISGSYSETEWKIYDLNNNMVAQRTNNSATTTYHDTLVLSPGCYKLEVSDAGCDGLQWWANPNAGTGSLKVNKTAGSAFLSPLPLSGYSNGDFGCGFTQYFTTNWPTAITNVNEENPISIEAYPNPANGAVTVNLLGLQSVNGILTVYDMLGRNVLQQRCTDAKQVLDLQALNNGMYTIIFIDAQTETKLQTRLIIAR